MQNRFLETLKQRPIIFDGAMGTVLQGLGMKIGGCPDELNITNPEMIKEVHKGYIKAGSIVVTTCTFGANRIKLKEYNLDKKLTEINMKAAQNAREAAGKEKFVAGGLGPTGRFLEPIGDLSFDEAVDIFSEQVNALKDGGVDLIIIETMMDIREMKAAIIAAKAPGLQ